ncbi:hypothetical protein B0A49_05897 [Cryomyces minteri]|uniref:Uncharacterized protein n=1 Tax=Cryomyces minteri TaxID=331657 RepID=A0A4U0WZP7_9PEZI|nr:hypothetical protein B0A49_05897 [Cryomyces minteri]
MGPWVSWAFVSAVAGGAYWYYTKQGKTRTRANRAASVTEQGEAQTKQPRRRENTKPKRKVDGTNGSEQSGSDVASARTDAQSNEDTSSESLRKRKGGKRSSTQPSNSPAVAATRKEIADVDEDQEDKDWARQLADLKKGTTLAPPAALGSRSKTVRQAGASGTPDYSGTSSSTVADIDDNQSPSPTAGGVSDMLEAPGAAPSTLRLTESAKPVRAREQKQQTAFQTQETKKQRQNRKKVEERKLQREEEEKERQVLAEKQRRTAREARGEPARNGVAPSKAPTTSAWAAQVASRAVGSAPSAAAPTAVAEHTSLLDTFDQDSTASSSGVITNGTSVTSSGTNFERELPSEEEQVALIDKMSEDAGWNTVAKGKKQKKKADDLSGNVLDTENNDSGYTPKALLASAKPVKANNTAPVNGYATLDLSSGTHGWEGERTMQDSDWAV